MKKNLLLIGTVIALFVMLLNFMAHQEGPVAKANHLPKPVSLKQKLIQIVNRGPYRFVVFGDWGAGTPFQKAVAAQLDSLNQREPFDSALLLGDNFYPDGDVKQFGKAYFTDMYAPLLQSGVNFIVALGNHDVLKGHQAEQRTFFKMPGYYYQVSKPHVDFFVLDTNTFSKSQPQQQWLDQALKASHAEWRVVLGHHPIYSSGEHGMNPLLKKSLEPLLVKHHVDLYLAGHDHDYERFAPIKGVEHIVSGGGGAYLRDFEKPLPNSLVRVKANHFLKFALSEQVMQLWAIDKTGKVIDQAEWKKSNQAEKQAS